MSKYVLCGNQGKITTRMDFAPDSYDIAHSLIRATANSHAVEQYNESQIRIYFHKILSKRFLVSICVFLTLWLNIWENSHQTALGGCEMMRAKF